MKRSHDGASTHDPASKRPKSGGGLDMAEIQRRIAEKRAQIAGNPHASALVPKSELATVSANQRYAQRIEKRSSMTNATTTTEPSTNSPGSSNNPYLATMDDMPAKPKYKRPALKFAPKGKYIQEAVRARIEAKKAELQRRVDQTTKQTGLDTELDRVGEGALKIYDPIPAVEWWDTQFLPSMSYADTEGNLRKVQLDELITDLVQHPIPIDPPFEKSEMDTQDVKLTRKERRKARRIRRIQEQKDKQEKIRLGLMEPEKPKVKISNMMRVYGQEASLDPTAIEKKVQLEIQERLEKHLRQNEERKLAPDERSAKRTQKFTEDMSHIVHSAIFRVKGGQVRPVDLAKIRLNAEQYHFVGVEVRLAGTMMILVQGGPKGIRRYKRLLLERVNWNAGEGDESDEIQTRGPIECVLVWEGQLPKAEFRQFRVHACETEQEVSEALGQFYHYWETTKHFI